MQIEDILLGFLSKLSELLHRLVLADESEAVFSPVWRAGWWEDHGAGITAQKNEPAPLDEAGSHQIAGWGIKT